MKKVSSWGSWLGIGTVALVSMVGCSDTNKNGQPDSVNAPAVDKAVDKAADTAGKALDKAGDVATDVASKADDVARNAVSAAENTPEIQAAFTANPSLKDQKINVDTTDKAVTLSGTVKNNAQKALAAKIAKQKAGNLKIINNLKVAGGAPSAAGKKSSGGGAAKGY